MGIPLPCNRSKFNLDLHHELDSCRSDSRNVTAAFGGTAVYAAWQAIRPSVNWRIDDADYVRCAALDVSPESVR